MKSKGVSFTSVGIFVFSLLSSINSFSQLPDERAKAVHGSSVIMVADEELPDPPILGGKKYEDEWKNSRCRVRVAPLEANSYWLMTDTTEIDRGTCATNQAFMAVSGNLRRLEFLKKPTDTTGKEAGWFQYKEQGANRFENCPYRIREGQPISTYLHKIIFDHNEFQNEAKKDPRAFFLKLDSELSKLVETNCPTS